MGEHLTPQDIEGDPEAAARRRREVRKKLLQENNGNDTEIISQKIEKPTMDKAEMDGKSKNKNYTIDEKGRIIRCNK